MSLADGRPGPGARAARRRRGVGANARPRLHHAHRVRREPPRPRPPTIAAATCPRRSRCASRWRRAGQWCSPVRTPRPRGWWCGRPEPADADAVWAILPAGDCRRRDLCVSAGHDPEAALAAWHPAGGHTFVAALHGRLAGTYLLKANQPGLGSHVANCGYMVASWARGRGLGEALCRHSLDAARGLGFRAMQFNSVVSTNRAAIAVWQRCGFAIVGTVPRRLRPPGARRRGHPRDAPAALERFGVCCRAELQLRPQGFARGHAASRAGDGVPRVAFATASLQPQRNMLVGLLLVGRPR